MKKNKLNGFTLIELLAVIVILAIIALIATPIVINIIEDSKNNSILRSADNYLDAVEQALAKENMSSGGTFNPNTCTITSEGDLICDSEELKVEVNGEKPNSGSISFNNGNIGEIELTYSNGKTIVKNDKGELVYSEVTKLCVANITKAKALVWQGTADPGQESSYAEEEVGLLASTDGAYTSGVAYTCNFVDDSEENNMIFYVLSSTENDVTLISGANLGNTVAWSEDGSNHEDESEDAQAVTAKAALAERTSSWSNANGGKLSEEQMLTIKLPTAYQIAEAVGQTFSDSCISGLPIWLNSYTKTPVAYGYWTSTPYADRSNFAWTVLFGCDVSEYYYYVDHDSLSGLRPVITISKSQLS